MKALILISLLSVGCTSLERRGVEVLETAIFGRTTTQEIKVEPKVSVESPTINVAPTTVVIVEKEKAASAKKESNIPKEYQSEERLVWFHSAPRNTQGEGK